MLFIWSLYALSGAGLIAPLPLRPALFIITFIYLLRGVAGPFALRDTGRSQRFIVVSSLICLGFGLVHLLGMTQRWGRWRNALFLQDGNKRLRGGAAVSAFALQPHRLPHRHGVGQCHFSTADSHAQWRPAAAWRAARAARSDDGAQRVGLHRHLRPKSQLRAVAIDKLARGEVAAQQSQRQMLPLRQRQRPMPRRQGCPAPTISSSVSLNNAAASTSADCAISKAIPRSSRSCASSVSPALAPSPQYSG